MLVFDNVGLNNADGIPVLQGINGRFQTGEFTVISGPGAAGKSSLARLMAGRIKPNSGQITRQGRISQIDQDPSQQFLTLTVQDEIACGLRKNKLGPIVYHNRISEAITWAGLTGREGDKLEQLSASEQRLVAIGGAYAARPDFLILDEPFSALDRISVCKIIQLLIGFVRDGGGVILICYDLERILAHADRLVLLKQGRIIADALPERVLPFLEAHGVRKPNLKLAEMTWLQSE